PHSVRLLTCNTLKQYYRESMLESSQQMRSALTTTTCIYHVHGNSQATRDPSLLTRGTDPHRLAVWTLPRLAERVQQLADEEYETIRHPALGMTPRQAYERSIERDGLRAHKQILYDETLRMATFPTTRKGTAKV